MKMGKICYTVVTPTDFTGGNLWPVTPGVASSSLVGPVSFHPVI
jgi:hypothetical protein